MKTTDNCLLDYGMQRNEGVMENVIVCVLNAREFKRRRILITIAMKHSREHGHAEGGNEYCAFVGLAL